MADSATHRVTVLCSNLMMAHTCAKIWEIFSALIGTERFHGLTFKEIFERNVIISEETLSTALSLMTGSKSNQGCLWIAYKPGNGDSKIDYRFVQHEKIFVEFQIPQTHSRENYGFCLANAKKEGEDS